MYREEDVIVVQEEYGRREKQIEGIIIDICRLAPVAIMGEDERNRTIRLETNEVVGGAYGSLLDGPNRLYLSEKFKSVASEVKKALKEFGYTLLEAENLREPLPFQTKIQTIYREPRDYLVMDAFFYWED